MDIGDRDGNARFAGIVIAHFLDDIQHVGRAQVAVKLMGLGDQLTQFLLRDELAQMPVFTALRVGPFAVEAQFLRQGFVVDCVADSRFDQAVAFVARLRIDFRVRDTDSNFRLDVDQMTVVGHQGLFHAAVAVAFPFGARLFDGHVVSAQDHVLSRDGDRLAVFRGQDVVDRQHDHAGFRLGFHGQWQMDGHLVAVEVGIVRRADQRMQRNGAALGQDWFKRLDAQAMQRRGAVQENRMFLDDLFQHVPDFRRRPFDHALGRSDVTGRIVVLETFHDKGFEQLQGHFLRQAALVHLHFRTDDDNGTAGIVDTFAQQVLAEAALFAFQHIRQGLEGTVAGARDRAAAAAVVDEGVHRFLQHTLFIADDDIRRVQIQETFQAIVAIDDAAIQVVQVARREAAAVELHHGAQVRRDHGDDVEDHPRRFVARLLECFRHFETADDADLLLARRVLQLGAQFLDQGVHVDFLEQFLDGRSAHIRAERTVTILIDGILVIRFRQEFFFRQARFARIQHDVVDKVQDAFQGAGRDIKNQAHPARDTLEVPNMGNRRSQLDMAHTVAAHLGARDFDAALVAHDTLVTDAFVLAAMAFPVLDRPEDALAEQAVRFRFQGSIVDGFRLFYFAVRPGSDQLRRCQTDSHRMEIVNV